MICDNLLLDSYNLIHRSRFDFGGGPALGENQIIYNLLKSLKPILEQFESKKVYFVLDGVPRQRLAIDSAYKGTRVHSASTPEEIAYWDSFHRQKRTIINIVKEVFPFTTIYHPGFECDDLLNDLAVSEPGDNVIVSADTDFIQSLDLSPNIRLFNPISKSFRERLDVDYTSYKSLVGDVSDNIPGVKGIGKVGAVKILKDPALFKKKMAAPDFKTQFDHSYSLVKFADVTPIKPEIQHFIGDFSRDRFRDILSDLNLPSMLSEPYLSRYCDVLEKIGKKDQSLA